MTCTCDDPGDGPCPEHHREMVLQDTVIELRNLLSTLLYWHGRDNGHIDESWWEEARRATDNKATHAPQTLREGEG